MLLRWLRCLRLKLFTNSRSNRFSSRFYAFRSALVGLSGFYAN